MKTLNLEDLTSDLHAIDGVAGLILAGSVAKKQQTDSSDIDVYIILNDAIPEHTVEIFKQQIMDKYKGAALDLSNNAVQTVSSFSHYAEIGTKFEWDRYNLVHTELLLDKTGGQLSQALESKSTLSDEERDRLIHNNLGAYINLTYRSIKSIEANNIELAKLDRAEALMYMLTTLFALKNKVRPFNKYLAWELEKYPLDLPRIDSEKVYTHIINSVDGRKSDQLVMYEIVEELSRNLGHNDEFDAWNNKLKMLKR